ncbi:hypothetical protein VTL71DRAFT_217 [Oculimacula yallundae]|uniref:Uncharacterized protein n=1 Tax=Oculimacula yallundae TaxID=86028 RepID=A0ABR4D1R4_9HELO
MSSRTYIRIDQIVAVAVEAASANPPPRRAPRPSSPTLALTDVLIILNNGVEMHGEDLLDVELILELEVGQSTMVRRRAIRRVTPTRISDPHTLASHDDGRCYFGPKSGCDASVPFHDFESRMKLDRKWRRVIPSLPPPPYTR